MLRKVEMPFNFTQGIDTQTDEKLNVKLEDLINGVHEGEGTISLRDGFTQMSTTDTDSNTIEPGLKVSSNGETLQLFTKKGAYDYSVSTDLWDKKSNYSIAQISATRVLNDPVFTSSTQIESAKMAAVDGFYAIESRSYLRVYDSNNNTEISREQVQTNPFVLGADIWSYKYSSIIDFRKLNKTTGQMDSEFSLAIADYPTPLYVTGTSNGQFLLLSIDSGSIDVTILSTAPAIVDTYTHTPSSGTITAAKGYFNGTSYIIGFYNNTSGSTFEIGILILDANLDLVSVNQYSFSSSVLGSNFTLTEDSDNYYFLAQSTTASNAVFHTIRKSDMVRTSFSTLSAKIESEFTRTFDIDYALISSDPGNSFYLLSSLGEFVAITNTGSLTATPDGDLGQISKVGDSFYFAVRTDSEDVKVMTANFDSPVLGREVELDGTTITPGSRLIGHDGGDFFSIGFAEAPEITNAAEGVTGNVTNGTYDYCVVLEYRDNKGRVWRSAPSNIVSETVTLAPTGVAVTYDIPAGFVGDSGQLFAELYRRTSGDLVFKKTAEEVASGSIIDETADNSSNEALYTTGGILENDPPPPADSIAIIGNRMWAVSVDDGLLYYSKPITPGLGIEFSLFQYIQFNDGGGRPICVAGMDEKVVVFKESSIYVIQGPGPNATGEGGVFSEPFKLPADVGCPYPASIVISPAGIMFKSKKGIRLLDRGLNVQNIGNEVATFNSETITSAILMEEKNQIRFTTQAGRALVYDYQYGQWETFDNYAAKSATQNFGKVIHIDTSGDVQQENETFQDNATGIPLTVTTPWIKAKNIQDYQRFYRLLILGKFISNLSMRVRAYYNYDNTSYDEYTLTHDTGVLQWQIHLKRQKCEAIKFEFYSTATSPLGAQLRLTNMTLQVGIKSGVYKLSDSRSY